MDLESAAANLHNQILQYQRSLGEIGLEQIGLPSKPAASLNQLGGRNSLGLNDVDAQLEFATRRLQQAVDHEQMPGLSKNLEIASERVALQQQLASAQLEQQGATVNGNVLGRFRQKPAQGSARRTASLLSLRQSGTATRQPSQQHRQGPLALPQIETETAAKTWRQRNPALAALMLEPVLYGYSIIAWAFVMLLSGISSAFCFYAGNKLPLRLPGRQQLPKDDMAASQNNRSQYFQYPTAAKFQRSVALDEEDEEGVEAWVRVPIKPERRASTTGYLDEEEDQCIRHPSSHYQQCGYVDEL